MYLGIPRERGNPTGLHFLGRVLGVFAFRGLEDISLRWVGYRGLVLGLLLIALVFVAPGGLARGLSTVVSAVRALHYSRQFRGSGDDG